MTFADSSAFADLFIRVSDVRQKSEKAMIAKSKPLFFMIFGINLINNKILIMIANIIILFISF